jgi:SAM-dependent methyltransferase
LSDPKAPQEANYGTYSNAWLIIGPFTAAAVLGGLAFLVTPLWARIILGVLAVLLALAGAYMAYLTRSFADDTFKKKNRDLILARLPWDGQGQALDIGTGSGLMAIGVALKFPNAHVVGSDTWAGGFMGLTQPLCQHNAAAEGVADRARFEEANACALPYADGEFDAVVSKDVFHAIRDEKDKLALIREALRVLRPGGAFVFQDPFGSQSFYPDLDATLEALRADGLTSVEFVWLSDVTHIPVLWRPIIGGPGILYGVK